MTWSIDLLAFLSSMALLLAYHIYVRVKVRQNPTYTVQAIHNQARAAWVDSVMANGRDILAVQTLRNSTMAATFLASTAVLLIMGVLTLSGQGDKLGSTWHALNLFGVADPALWLLKTILLMLDLCFAFFCFTLAVRKFHHVGYLINLPKSFEHPIITPRYVAAYLNRAGRYYGLGMRAYYFTLPLLFWMFGPHLMLASSLALVFLLHHLDRAYDEGG